MLPNRCHFHFKMPENGLVMRLLLCNLLFPLDFRFFNHRDFRCFFVILLSTFCIFHRSDFIYESFCTQSVLTNLCVTFNILHNHTNKFLCIFQLNKCLFLRYHIKIFIIRFLSDFKRILYNA